MSDIVKIKNTDKVGTVECYEGDGEYIVNLEDGTQGWFNENELEFVNCEPYANNNHKAIKNLILMINSYVPTFECMDIDNENFIDAICKKSGLDRDAYMEIMELS